MSRDLKNKVENSLNEIKFRGSSLREFNVIDGINIDHDTVTVILNIKNIKEHVPECKKEVEKFLLNDFERVLFIETSNTSSESVVDEMKTKKKFDNIKKVILISSGKGGVGKTTIAYYMAAALASLGNAVGVLDADIYGPSVPVIASINEEPKMQDGYFIPVEKAGVKYNSVGFLIPKGKSLVWRGPMITKALHKLFNSTDWGELDYLLIDMPPGTGDIHLTICQTYHVDKVVMVTTPSALAEADVERAEDMYHKLGLKNQVKLCNMSFLECEGMKIYPFGNSDANWQIPLLHKNREEMREVLVSFLENEFF